MKLIVGLGNPGLQYKKTRHNVGFMFVDELVKQYKGKFTLNKSLKCELFETLVANEKLIIIKPQTFMNLSGESVKAVCNYYNISVNDILVIHDDMDLPTGKVRIRPSGSSGGQKGMKNIIDLLLTQDIKRIRIGIDHSSNDTVDYVLGKFSKEDSILISLVTSKASDMIASFITETFENFMNRFNHHE